MVIKHQSVSVWNSDTQETADRDREIERETSGEPTNISTQSL